MTTYDKIMTDVVSSLIKLQQYVATQEPSKLTDVMNIRKQVIELDEYMAYGDEEQIDYPVYKHIQYLAIR